MYRYGFVVSLGLYSTATKKTATALPRYSEAKDHHAGEEASLPYSQAMNSNIAASNAGLCVLTLQRSCAKPRSSTKLVERSRAHQQSQTSRPPLTTRGGRPPRRPRSGPPWPQQKLTTSKTSNRDTARGFNSMTFEERTTSQRMRQR